MVALCALFALFQELRDDLVGLMLLVGFKTSERETRITFPR